MYLESRKGERENRTDERLKRGIQRKACPDHPQGTKDRGKILKAVRDTGTLPSKKPTGKTEGSIVPTSPSFLRVVLENICADGQPQPQAQVSTECVEPENAD